MPDDTNGDRVDPEFALNLERERVQSELALSEFRGSLPVFDDLSDPIEAFVTCHEQWYQHVEHVTRTAQVLGQKYGCEIRTDAIQDVLQDYFVEASRRIEPRLYERARQHHQLDRWITEVEDIQALIGEYDRAERFNLIEERGERFHKILHARIGLEKHIPAELRRLRRLGASIPPLRAEPRITTSLHKRLIEILTGKLVPAVLLAKQLGINTTQLRSVISRLNKPDRFILNVRGEGYYLRDHPPVGREDLPRV